MHPFYIITMSGKIGLQVDLILAGCVGQKVESEIGHFEDFGKYLHHILFLMNMLFIECRRYVQNNSCEQGQTFFYI